MTDDDKEAAVQRLQDTANTLARHAQALARGCALRDIDAICDAAAEVVAMDGQVRDQYKAWLARRGNEPGLSGLSKPRLREAWRAVDSPDRASDEPGQRSSL
jgi:hypothetical protein